jgi:hypothetical protein
VEIIGDSGDSRRATISKFEVGLSLGLVAQGASEEEGPAASPRAEPDCQRGPAARKVCPLPNTLPRTGEGIGSHPPMSRGSFSFEILRARGRFEPTARRSFLRACRRIRHRGTRRRGAVGPARIGSPLAHGSPVRWRGRRLARGLIRDDPSPPMRAVVQMSGVSHCDPSRRGFRGRSR